MLNLAMIHSKKKHLLYTDAFRPIKKIKTNNQFL